MTLVCRFFFAFLVVLATPARAQEDGSPLLEGFPDFRQEMSGIVAGATSRLWLMTEYLTDGDIVSTLYIAKYRKIDVQILLGRQKANAYMSRLNYLKTQGIPVFLKPDAFKIPARTAILSDNTLYFADGDLDFLTRTKQFRITVASDAERDGFVARFSEALALKLPANPRLIPLVGRPAKQRPASHGQPSLLKAQEPKSSDQIGVYHYKRSSDPRPPDVPSKLPKGLKWDKQAAKDKPIMTTPVFPVPRADGG